jgi:intein/homing endonuclease
MKIASELKPGDKVIYKSGSKVMEATVVAKPIDDQVRPKFLIGRVDLDNGDYLVGGANVYDSVEECKQDIIKGLKQSLEDAKMNRDFHAARVTMIEKELEKLTK